MQTVLAFDVNGGELPEQVKQFVADLNWLRDEGFIDYETDKEGHVRIIPRSEVHGELRP